MSDLRAYDRPADRIRLHRQVDRRPLLVLEGPSDERFCGRVLADYSFGSFPVGSRSAVVVCVTELVGAGLPAVLGLVDRDFIEGPDEAGLSALAYYDGADLEGMLIATGAFDELVSEFGSAEKIARFGGVSAVREAIVDRVVPIARLRTENAQRRLGLRFDSVELADKTTLTDVFVKATYCDALHDRSDKPSGVTVSALRALFERDEPARRCPSGLPMVRGKDALAVLGQLLRRQLGSLSRDAATPEHLASALRLSASSSVMGSTSWFEHMTAWLRACSP